MIRLGLKSYFKTINRNMLRSRHIPLYWHLATQFMTYVNSVRSSIWFPKQIKCQYSVILIINKNIYIYQGFLIPFSIHTAIGLDFSLWDIMYEYVKPSAFSWCGLLEYWIAPIAIPWGLAWLFQWLCRYKSSSCEH